ncbi:hypothetical protein CDAR_183721, partial [Caerostris darwini]
MFGAVTTALKDMGLRRGFRLVVEMPIVHGTEQIGMTFGCLCRVTIGAFDVIKED